ncbi:hypothetical protein TWF481_006718 [Arthrobotrys musiformis]|uniref:Uncharacterized protein n=1 Tax=Arthrobotrys musiformis TaxID=47236 RepID=A0AAV9WBQ2_9PEZI
MSAPSSQKGKGVVPEPSTNNNLETTIEGLQGAAPAQPQPQTADLEALEAAKRYEQFRKVAAKKCLAFQRLTALTLEQGLTPGTREAQLATHAYIGEALEIFETLGPQFEMIICLKLMRGIECKTLKTTISNIMWSKDWKIQDVCDVLRASVEYLVMWLGVSGYCFINIDR